MWKWLKGLPRVLVSALALLVLGLLSLVACVWVAYVSGPTKTDETGLTENVVDVSPETCSAAQQGIEPSDSDARGALRLIAVAPEKVAIGRRICLVVAGVAANEPLAEALNRRDQARDRLEEARVAGGRDTEIPALEQQAKTAERLVDLARSKAAPDAKDPVKLVVYLNDAKSPFDVDGRSTDAVQRLLFRLDAPANAADPDAEFWRKLVRGAVEGLGNDGVSGETSPTQRVFGEVPITVGLSRAVSAADIPEVQGGAEATLPLYVYSRSPFWFGIAGLACLTLGFALYSCYTPILRDNGLTRRMLPSQLAAAKLGLEEAEAAAARARVDLDQARAAGGPVEAAKSNAVVAAAAAVDRATTRLEQVVVALGADPAKYKDKWRETVAAATAFAQASADGGADAKLAVLREAFTQLDAAQRALPAASGLVAAEAAREKAEDDLQAGPASDELKKAAEAAERRLEKARALDAAIARLIDTVNTREATRVRPNAVLDGSFAVAQQAYEVQMNAVTRAAGKVGTDQVGRFGRRTVVRDSATELSQGQKAAVRWNAGGQVSG